MTTKSEPWRQGRVLGGAPDALVSLREYGGLEKGGKPRGQAAFPFRVARLVPGTGLCEPDNASELRRPWTERPGEALAVYRHAVMLREAIYQILRSRICSEALRDKEVRVLNRVLAAAPRHVCLAPTSSGFGWWVATRQPAPADMLAPIAWSAAGLLTGPQAQRVRQCADEKGCGWLFIDESRAGTRRWCSMGECEACSGFTRVTARRIAQPP
jgi:predicted RNA-binding Zn ribbon-like protein